MAFFNRQKMSSTPPHESDNEKAIKNEKAVNVTEYDRYSEGHGDMQVFRTSDSDNLKLAKDGKTVLIPQPSDDSEDVLNWPMSKKYSVLASLVFASLVGNTAAL